MKKIAFSILFTMFATLILNAQDLRLPDPTRAGGMPLSEALDHRQTTREFSDVMLSQQQLSDLLWAANGVNRKDGRRTAPTARNCQEIEVYVFIEKGIYLYDAQKNLLKLVKLGDFRKDIVMQPFAATAPVVLVFVADYDKMQMDDEAKAFYGATDAGYVSQNVYLHCAANKMNTVVLGSIQRDKIKELIGLKNGKAILGQPVGLAK